MSIEASLDILNDEILPKLDNQVESLIKRKRIIEVDKYEEQIKDLKNEVKKKEQLHRANENMHYIMKEIKEKTE